MRQSRISVLAVGLLVVSVSAARAETKKVCSVEGITEYQLDNGMRVLLFPDATKPMVTTNLTVLVGSRHEGYGEAGMAHLLEHMLFKGTPTFPDPKKLMTDHGARWNGTTWVDRTNYFETVPASDENLDLCIRFEADRLVNCPIRQEDLSSEMTVVRNEFEIGENSPPQVLMKHMQSVAFDWHNYGKSTIGNRSDIERVPADKLRVFYKKYYQPDNAMLIIAGRFDETKALQLAEKYCGAIPRPSRTLDEPYTEEPAQDGERVVTLRRVGDVGVVAMMYHVPAGSDPEFAAADALSEVLSDSPSGLLYKALVETNKAASVGGWAEACYDPGTLLLTADVRPNQSIDEVRNIMSKTLDQVGEQGVTQEQVDRVKRRFASFRSREMADTSRLAVDLSNWASQGDWRLFFLMRDRIERLSPQAVQDVAKKYLRASNRTVGLYIPSKQPDRTPVPPRPNVAELLKDYKGRGAVAAGEQLDPDPMKIESRVRRQELPGGIKAALLPKKSRQQLVSLRLVLRYGDEQSLRGKSTAADVLPELMTRGTKQMSRQQIADALDGYHATLRASGGAGEMTFSMNVERPHLNEALEVLRQVLREPTLPSDEFDIMRRETLAGLEQERTEPTVLARSFITQKLNPYNKDDPRYQPTPAEQLERYQKLTLDDVKSLYRDYIGASNGELAVVGDFDTDELLTDISKIVGDWKSPKPYERLKWQSVDPVKADETINAPDKANGVYLAVLPVPMNDANGDYPALMMASDVLGGSAGSRLWARLREKEGFSYGTGAHLMARSLDASGTFMEYAAFNPQNGTKLKAAAAEELRKMLADGMKPAELETARSDFLRGRMMSRSEDARLADLLVGQLYAGRTMHYEADLEDKVKALSPDDVLAAAKKYIDPDKLTIVEAGDFQKASAPKP